MSSDPVTPAEERTMTASRSARQRRAAAQAGDLATVTVDLGVDDALVYKIRCRECEGRPGKPWSTYRAGSENDFMGAMDRWTLHLTGKHPAAQAPCLEFLDQVHARLAERRPGG